MRTTTYIILFLSDQGKIPAKHHEVQALLHSIRHCVVCERHLLQGAFPPDGMEAPQNVPAAPADPKPYTSPQLDEWVAFGKVPLDLTEAKKLLTSVRLAIRSNRSKGLASWPPAKLSATCKPVPAKFPTPRPLAKHAEALGVVARRDFLQNRAYDLLVEKIDADLADKQMGFSI